MSFLAGHSHSEDKQAGNQAGSLAGPKQSKKHAAKNDLLQATQLQHEPKHWNSNGGFALTIIFLSDCGSGHVFNCWQRTANMAHIGIEFLFWE